MEDYRLKVPLDTKKYLLKFKEKGYALVDEVVEENLPQSKRLFLIRNQKAPEYENINQKFKKRLQQFLKQCLHILQNSTSLSTDEEDNEVKLDIVIKEFDEKVRDEYNQLEEDIKKLLTKYIGLKDELEGQMEQKCKQMLYKVVSQFDSLEGKIVVKCEKTTTKGERLIKKFTDFETKGHHKEVERTLKLVEYFDTLYSQLEQRENEEMKEIEKFKILEAEGLL